MASILLVPSLATVSSQARSAFPITSGFLRTALDKGDTWSVACDPVGFDDSLVIAWRAPDDDAGLGEEDGPTFDRHFAFVHAKVGPVEHEESVGPPEETRLIGMSEGGRATSSGPLVVAYGVWGRSAADCYVSVNNVRRTPAVFNSGDALHLDAGSMQTAAFVQSSVIGEQVVGAHYERDLTGTLFALLLPDTGYGLIQGPEGQFLLRENSVVVSGEDTSGRWIFDVPAGQSGLGLQLWILAVP